MHRDLRAYRSLVHPLWIGSLALLLLNDHALKGAGLLPGWVTGKLSDFAGMLVAPAVLAALLGVASRRGLLGAHVATGAVFSAIKLAPEAARALERVMAMTPLPWRITVDPTDLVALPALVVSYRVLGAAMRRPDPVHPIARRLALLAGSLACMATSRVEPPCDEGGACAGLPQEPASLVIGNTTEEERLIRVRRLRHSVRVDCSVVLADPTGALSRDLFADAETWLIAPGRALPLQNDGCDAYLVDADGLPLTLLAWSADEFPPQIVSTSTESPTPDRMIALQRAGARLELAEHPAVFPAPPLELPPPADACDAPAEGSRLDWTLPTSSTAVVAGVISSPDGCHAIALERRETFYVCVPAEAMPFQAGDVISVRPIAISHGSYPELPPGQQASASGVYIESETHAVLALRGNVLARASMAGRREPAEFSADLAPLDGCDVFHDACGGLVAPLEASLLGQGVSGVVSLRAGQSALLASEAGSLSLHLVRAEDMPVRDEACFTAPVGQPRLLESVLVAAPAAP